MHSRWWLWGAGHQGNPFSYQQNSSSRGGAECLHSFDSDSSRSWARSQCCSYWQRPRPASSQPPRRIRRPRRRRRRATAPSSSPPTACGRTSSPGMRPRACCRRCRPSSRRASRRRGNGLLTQAPPNTGAGWYSLATGAWPGVHGSTNNTFHINGQPFGNRDRGLRPERPPGRVDRSVRRAGRPQGRPGRVGGRPQRDDPGPDDRLPVVLLRPRRRHELHRQGG